MCNTVGFPVGERRECWIAVIGWRGRPVAQSQVILQHSAGRGALSSWELELSARRESQMMGVSGNDDDSRGVQNVDD